MQIRRITFQSAPDTPLKFSDDYTAFIDYMLEVASEKPAPAVKAMQLEVLRRKRILEGVDSKAPLKEELNLIAAEGLTALQANGQAMIKFLEHLENDFAGPPRWACTSHYDVNFWLRDYENFSDTLEEGGAILHVRVSMEQSGKEYQLTDGHGKTILETSDAYLAAQKAAEILESADGLSA